MVPILIFFLFNHNALLSISAHFHKGKEILIINTNLIFFKVFQPTTLYLIYPCICTDSYGFIHTKNHVMGACIFLWIPPPPLF